MNHEYERFITTVQQKPGSRGRRPARFTLREAISGKEFADVMAELPDEYATLLDRS